MPITPGARLGPYEILGLLGAGGMGEVYEASDPRLGRSVAIKVLAPQLVDHPGAVERFEREARAIAALAHPSIVAIYDLGIEGSTRYVVTELLRGSTLRERLIDKGPIGWEEAVRMTCRIAEGLAAAHDRGITHRDIKPENIFLTDHGPKILDFGLVRVDERFIEELGAADDTIARTPAGLVLGTIGYMSPEQVAGRHCDETTDIFSLGCVLYEMLSGARAFSRPTAAEVMHAILKEEPPALPVARIAAPLRLEPLVLKCLEKEPARRFSSPNELTAALEQLFVPDSNDATLPHPAPPVSRTIAVLPFLPDPGDDALAPVIEAASDAVTGRLSAAARVKVLAASRVRKFRGREVDAEATGRELGATMVLSGFAMRTSSGAILQLELLDVEGGAQIWGERLPLDTANQASDPVDEIAERIVSRLSAVIPMKTAVPSAPTALRDPVHAVSSEASEIVGKARAEAERGTPSGIRRAADILEEAARGDRSPAVIHARLAEMLLEQSVSGFVSPGSVREQIQDALATSSKLAPRAVETLAVGAAISLFLDADRSRAMKTIEKAIADDAESADVKRRLAEILVATGRRDEAVVEAKRAVQLDPASVLIGMASARVLYNARRFADAAELCHSRVVHTEGANRPKILLALSLTEQSMFDDAHRELQPIPKGSEEDVEVEAALAYLYARWKRRPGALKIIRKLAQPAGNRYVPPYFVARAYAALGDTDNALEALGRSKEERSPMLAWLPCDPAFDAIRQDARLRDLERS